MAYAHLPELKRLLDTSGCVPLDRLHDVYLQGAIFAVSDDEAYFVVEADGMYHAVIGAVQGTSKEGKFWGTHFIVNQINTFTYRDSAIACALCIAVNDSGGPDSTSDRPKEIIPYLCNYNA
jgi:hypothetical protein